MSKNQPNPPQVNGLALLIAIAAILLALFSFIAVKLAG
jgi:hypothetical protein